MPDYRIDDLAREAGTTVRNVRAYQDRGLLPPPRRAGRVGIYTDAHLARLRLIGQLLERGYTLASIRELVDAWEQGHGLGDLLGLGAALSAPFSDETPDRLSTDDLEALFGPATPEEVDRAVELGLLEREGDGFRVPSPRLLQAGAELVRAGVPLGALLDDARLLRADVERIARRFVDLVGAEVFGRDDELPGPEDAARMTELVQRLRPLGGTVVAVMLAQAMERSVRAQLDDRLARLLEQVEARDEAS